MTAISLGYKTSPVELREKIAFDDNVIYLLFEMFKKLDITEAVYLSTCNRCEVYVSSNVYAALEVLSELSKIPLCVLKNHVLIFEGKSAIQHLFKVTCGFDSMVMGEDEILGQVKRAYLLSKQAGFTDYEFNTVFKSAVTCAKKIKTETMISKSSVSIATLAGAKCHKFALGKKTALIIGASGETGGKLCKNLISYGDFEVFATARETHISQKDVNIIPYSERYLYMDIADVIVSATKSPHFTVTYDKLAAVIKTKKPRLFIDLAVPRDIDKTVCELDGAQLITIDEFERLAQHNNEVKQREFASANEIAEHELDLLFKELLFHQSLGFLNDFAASNQYDDFMHFVYKLRDVSDAAAFESFIETLKKLK